jgi:hypothetical protein
MRVKEKHGKAPFSEAQEKMPPANHMVADVRPHKDSRSEIVLTNSYLPKNPEAVLLRFPLHTLLVSHAGKSYYIN